MKKIVLLLMIFLCLFSCISASAEDIEIYMFGKKVETDVAPFIEDGRTLVPVRAITENGMGAKVKWDGKLQQVTITKDDLKILLTIGKTEVFVNDEKVHLDVPAKIISDRTMIPVRFVSETLKYKVDWDGERRQVIINKMETHESIEKIDVEKTLNDNLLNIKMSALEKPNIFTLKEPYRIVLDFKETKFDGHDGKINVETGYITQVRWADHEGYYRIVIECPGEQPYKYVRTGDSDFSIIVGTKSTEVDLDKKDDKDTADKTDKTDKDDEKDDDIKPTTPPKDRKTLVVIDAGHGGKDPGALGRDEEGEIIYDENEEEYIKEKDINLAVAKKVSQFLKDKGVNVVMTRSKDEFLELREIADIANEEEATLFVSIHCNSVDGVPTANGTEVLYYDTEEKEAFGITSEKVAKTVLEYMLDVVDMYDRGVRERPELAVLRLTEMPAILIELGFVTNADDQEKLIDPEWQADAAWGIAQGINAVIKQMK